MGKSTEAIDSLPTPKDQIFVTPKFRQSRHHLALLVLAPFMTTACSVDNHPIQITLPQEIPLHTTTHCGETIDNISYPSNHTLKITLVLGKHGLAHHVLDLGAMPGQCGNPDFYPTNHSLASLGELNTFTLNKQPEAKITASTTPWKRI